MNPSPDNASVPQSPQTVADAPITSEDKPKRLVGQRRLEILQAMAQMLESPQWQKITTAALAQKIGFSEAALYRHYRSKAEMYSAIIDFIDHTFIDLFKNIQSQSTHPLERLSAMGMCLLRFAEDNRGLTRVLTGEALQNEHEDLGARMERIFTRIEEHWKTLLREALLAQIARDDSVVGVATLLMNSIIGAWWRFSKSGYRILPTQNFDRQWALIVRGNFD